MQANGFKLILEVLIWLKYDQQTPAEFYLTRLQWPKKDLTKRQFGQIVKYAMIQYTKRLLVSNTHKTQKNRKKQKEKDIEMRVVRWRS